METKYEIKTIKVQVKLKEGKLPVVSSPERVEKGRINRREAESRSRFMVNSILGGAPSSQPLN